MRLWASYIAQARRPAPSDGRDGRSLSYQITREQQYLDEARRIARSAEARFVNEDGVITGPGKLGVKLIEAFLTLSETDGDAHWRHVVRRCLSTLHRHRNEAGWYPQNWEAEPPPAERPVRLIDQAAPARAYWVAAEHGRTG